MGSLETVQPVTARFVCERNKRVAHLRSEGAGKAPLVRSQQESLS